MNHLEYLFVSGNICPSAWPNAGKRCYRTYFLFFSHFYFSYGTSGHSLLLFKVIAVLLLVAVVWPLSYCSLAVLQAWDSEDPEDVLIQKLNPAEQCRGVGNFTTIIVLELVLAWGEDNLYLLLTGPCPGMNIVLEICLVPPFLQGRWKHESSKMVLCCHSWLQFLWWTALEKFKAVLFPEIFLWNNISLCLFFITLYFLALPLLAGRQAVPLPGEILFLGDYSVVLKCEKLPISQNSACSSRILLESQDVSIVADLF